jgi:protein-tyrosine-phosphatase
MELRQKDRIHSLYPHARGKVVLLGCFDPENSLEIADPYGGTVEDFRGCFEQISRCCENLAARLNLSHPVSVNDRKASSASEYV